ncbi:MAG: bacillithiol biosynthesis BshC [Phycisphaeraceae bacterium]
MTPPRPPHPPDLSRSETGAQGDRPAAHWPHYAVPPERVPLIGRDAFIARLAAGAFVDDVPLLDFNQPPAPPSDTPFLNRAALAEALADGNAALGNPLNAETLAAIRGEGRMVIAGQQPGLLLGPMFTLLKAVTAVNAAEQLQPSLNVPIVPAFWIASEDHDLEEVNRVTVGDGKLVLDHPQLHRPGPRPPVGHVTLSDHRAELERFVEQAANDLPHGRTLADLTAELNLSSYATQFGQLLARLLRRPGAPAGGAGIVLVDPEWLRDLTAPVLAAAAERWADLETALQQGRDHLAQQDLTPPLERVNLFKLDQWDRRVAEDVTPDSPAEIRRNPEQFSPSAALRPIVQDAILPTLATVAGPTELLYLWQIDPLYRVMHMQRSWLLPRLSATLLDARTAHHVERLNLPEPTYVFDVFDHLRELENAPAVDDADLSQLQSLAEQLTEELAAIDEPAERKTIGKAINSIRYRIDRVTRRVHQRRLDRDGVGRRSLQRIADVVYPHHQLQERRMSVLEAVGRLGPGLVHALRRLDVTRFDHHLLLATQPPAGVTASKESHA